MGVEKARRKSRTTLAGMDYNDEIAGDHESVRKHLRCRASRLGSSTVRTWLPGQRAPHRTAWRHRGKAPIIRRNRFVTTLDPDMDALIRAMPKAELHVHLEGSVRPATLLTLARRHGVDLGCQDEAELRELYRFRDFRHFIELYKLISEAMRAPE